MLPEIEHITHETSFKNRVRENALALPDIGFNATMFSVRWGGVDSSMRPVILSRKSSNAIPAVGEPDFNSLEVSALKVEPSGHKVIRQVTIWKPEKVTKSLKQPYVCNYEDFRANPTSPDGLCGLTVIEKTPGRLISPNLTEPAKFTPYPGIVRLPNNVVSLEQSFGELPEVTTLRSLGPGKNLTPIGKVYDNQDTFLFRLEGEENNHKLQVVTYNEKTKETKVINTLEFPITSWSKWRIGTAAGLFWLDKKHAILPIHGISKEYSMRNAEELFNYSLGVALIRRDEHSLLQVVKVADKPLIVPSQLDHLMGERFKFKHIAYSCYDWLEGSVFNFLVNKGDKGTILEKITLKEVFSSLI